MPYLTQFCTSIRPEPDLTVSEWSDRHRILDQAGASEPGKWRTGRTPYLREIMDCLSATRPESVVVFMKGAQIGATESGNNWLGYVIHHAPGPMLYVMPTVDAAKRASKQRIAPMIDSIPEIREKVATPRARDTGNTLFQKDYPGGTLILTGANSAVGLRSIPARFLFLDEVDSYPMDLEGEGSPIQLAIRRTATYKRNRKVFMVSTPTIRGLSIIEDYYSESDQRRFFVPCPDCGEFQTIEWKRITWPEGDPDSAAMTCEHCGVLIPETQKTNLLNNGEWRATGEGRHTGFHLSSLYSPAGWYSWADAANDFLAAKRSGIEQLKTWINTVLGESFEEQGEQADPNELIMRREEYPDDLPILWRTVGVDVQKDRLELELVGWGEGEESWGLEYVILPGDTAQQPVWDSLTETLAAMKPDAVAVDSGYNTQFVYSWVERKRYAWAIKGVAGAGLPLIEDLQRRIRRLRKKRQRAVTPEPIGVDQGKTIIYSRIGISEPGPGFMHFPLSADYDDEYMAQLTAEKLVTRYHRGRPKQEWVQTRPRNEALDCRVYALAALRLLNPKQPSAKPEPAKPKPAPFPPEKQKIGPKRQPTGGAWL